MAITHVAHGTLATGTNPVPGEPAGIQVRDLLLCFARTFAAGAVAPTMGSDWRQVAAVSGTGSGAVLINGRVFAFEYMGTSPDYTVTASSNPFAFVAAYRPTVGNSIVVNPDAAGIGTVVTTSTTVNYPDLTPRSADEMRVWAWFLGSALGISNGAISGTNPTPTEEYDPTDGGYADGTLTAQTATGARTSTLTSACGNVGLTMLLADSPLPSLPSVNLPPTMRGGF